MYVNYKKEIGREETVGSGTGRSWIVRIKIRFLLAVQLSGRTML